MGSTRYIPVKKAMAILGVCERSVYRYITRGLLHSERDGRHTYVDEDDVLNLKKGRKDILSSSLNKDIITKLQIEVQTLKSQMSTVMRMLNIKYDPINMSLPEYELFYKAADQYSIEGWPPHVEEMWAEYFLRLRTDDLEKIEAVTNDPHPWRPFLRLVSTMYLNPYTKELTEMLAAGKNNLQQVAGIWCVLKEESPRTFDVLVDRDATPLKKLIKRIQKDQTS